MSDKRRRRRRASGESSDEEEEASITASDHEYESAAEEDSALEGSDLENEDSSTKLDPKVQEETDKNNLEVDDGILDLSDKEEILEEREAGDGQEQQEANKNGKVDDDEDRRNPQYIPKKGMFYEHDDRIDSADEAEQESSLPSGDNAGAGQDNEAKPKRVPRSETIDKWGHDKFLEREQAPKTKEELVSTYGYDIRNEDSAPRARRRRRYGRGPNKYTRNWEDEKAYEPPGKEEKPTRNSASSAKRGGHRTSAAPPAGGAAERQAEKPEKTAASSRPVKLEDKNQFPDLPGSKSESKPKEEQVKQQKSDNKGSKRDRGSNPNNARNKSKPNSSNSVNQRLHKEPRPPTTISSNSEQKSSKKLVEKAVEAKLDKVMDIIEQKQAKNSPKNNRKMENGAEENGRQANKRYSNSRQQAGPRSNNQEQHQTRQRHQNQDFKKQFNDINGSNSAPHPATTYANANFPTNASGPPPAAPFLPAGVAAAAAAAAASVATPTSTSGFLDPSTMVNYGPPPPVQFTPVAPVTVTVPIVSGVPGAPPLDTLAVQLAPQLPNVTTPADQVLLAAAAAASHQGYAEVRGGVTYFNPTAQPPMMARPMSKRPKAAIPIVDPSQVTSSSSTDHQEHSNGQEQQDQHLQQQEMVKT